MKKYLVIVALFTYLFSATEFSELLKLPDLFEHFTEHRSKNRAISFLDFLAIHYCDEQGGDADDGRDMTLPFKSHANCPHIAEQFNVLPGDPACIRPPVSFILKSFQAIEEDSDATFHSSIWQPPKLT